jgi:hypothetical protein
MWRAGAVFRQKPEDSKRDSARTAFLCQGSLAIHALIDIDRPPAMNILHSVDEFFPRLPGSRSVAEPDGTWAIISLWTRLSIMRSGGSAEISTKVSIVYCT